MDFEILLHEASEHVADVPSGQTFFAKDLFSGTVWNQLKRGDKLRFGLAFKRAVSDGKFSDVEYVGKAQNNSARYRKK